MKRCESCDSATLRKLGSCNAADWLSTTQTVLADARIRSWPLQGCTLLTARSRID